MHHKTMKTAFFFDIDGTLYQNDYHIISPTLMDALNRLASQNIPLWIVSSRSLFEIQNLPSKFLNLPFTGWILEGGSLILDPCRKPVCSWPLSIQDTQKVAAYCREHGLTWRYSTLQGSWFDQKPSLSAWDSMIKLYLNAPDTQKWQSHEVLNALIWLDEDKDLHEANIRALLPEASIVRYEGAMEIRAACHGKEDAIRQVRKQNGYGKVICFGDGENDAGMLKQADTGVAMGNGSPKAKEAADFITGSVAEDGVVQYLRRCGWL